MTITQMQYFKSVAENGTLAKASKECFVSSAAISKSLRDIEQKYDIQLFKNVNNRLIITEKGIFLKKKIDIIIKLYDQLNNEIISKPRVKIGVSIFLSTPIFKNFEAIFFNQFQNIKFEISELPSKNIVKQIKKHELDFGLVINEKGNCFF